MKAPHARLFEDVRWSTEPVAAETLERVKKLGLEAVTLPPWYDVDDRASLQRLLHDLSIAASASGGRLTPYPAPATAECVERLKLRDRLGKSEFAGRPAGSADRVAI